MSQPLLDVGGFVFETGVNAFEVLERNSTYKWVKMARLGAWDSHQYLGPEKQTVRITGTLIALNDPTREDWPGVFRAFAETAEPFQVITGAGDVWEGFWVIEKIQEIAKKHIHNGRPRTVAYVLELKRYGGEGV